MGGAYGGKARGVQDGKGGPDHIGSGGGDVVDAGEGSNAGVGLGVMALQAGSVNDIGNVIAPRWFRSAIWKTPWFQYL